MPDFRCYMCSRIDKLRSEHRATETGWRKRKVVRYTVWVCPACVERQARMREGEKEA